MIRPHSCNAYCRGVEHCEQLRISPGASRDTIWQALAASHHVWVTDAIPAREPAPWAHAYLLAGANPLGATEPWLVWWREDYSAARRDYEAGAIPRYRSQCDE